MTRLLIAALMASLVTPMMAQSDSPDIGVPGYDRMDVKSPHRAWPIAASVWYPAGSKTYFARIGDNPIWHGMPVLQAPRVAEGKHPLILFSHGSGGNMDGMAWLLSGLAQEGAMVLAVNHPGSTSGDSSPRRSMRLDERAQDLSAALDVLLAEPAFASYVDLNRIYSVGFSLGGATALNLAGLQFDASAYAPYCGSSAEMQRLDCQFFAKGGVDFANLPAGFSADMRDPRVSKAVAIDPAFTYVATEASLSAMELPVQLINLGDEAGLAASDVSAKGSDLAAKLGDVDYVTLAPASHFTALPECKPQGAAILEEEQDDPICTDPEGADRKEIHRQMLAEIARFLEL
ncbi:Alpha/beta hydrolase family protein [Pelagimonas phthalicica]|uniref:Alpha/beta hydrolase family protein n=1 Tax=Pelagimonas phthalicica TaxID=1037362 RepID=A0A238JBL9_9RHOB|nr:alpha/beta fold hydrolase [Pelagimonas phthalicica]TDS93919.1 putative dienelactone hydrolase [Pelagimonas phthalicica]SMX27557.1 Alpha/beta hydrolase family protein [Pelagimonas phthalicica]